MPLPDVAPSGRKLPTGAAREDLRAKGQFWTPDWVADAMVAYACGADAQAIFDPAVGAGAFFRAARRQHPRIALHGAEVEPDALDEALRSGLAATDLRQVARRDFVLDPPPGSHSAIVANPPYLRHHRLSLPTKERLARFCQEFLGFAIDRRAGYHVYFLLRALQRLAPGGRLAFIVPADLCEGVFAQRLWRRLAQAYRLDAVVTFAPEATPFPGVDTNALILLMANLPPLENLHWARCARRGEQLLRWARSNFGEAAEGMTVQVRPLPEALASGLSRPPRQRQDSVKLGDFCTVMRGIATGANDFFFLTADQIRRHRLPARAFRRAIGRTRDLDGDEVSAADLDRLDQAGRPTYLFSLSDAWEKLSPAVRNYLQNGEQQGFPHRALIATRRPWYKMEVRQPPPFLFAYLGRRSSRFIRNRAGVLPLTGFLCIYPRPAWSDGPRLDALWEVLRHPATRENLALVGKSYGGGAIKVEPRALECLPLPDEAAAGLAAWPLTLTRRQMRLNLGRAAV